MSFDITRTVVPWNTSGQVILKYIKINLGKHIIRMVLFCKLSVYHAEDICHADWALLLLL